MECPKCLTEAIWLNVPSGPRKPTEIGSWSARDADIISV